MKEKIKNVMEPILLGLILFDVVLLAIITIFTLPEKTEDLIVNFDIIVCIILLIEFSYHLIKSENKTEFLKQHWFELIAAIPIDFFLLRSLRFIRVLRILKFAKILSLVKTDSHFLHEYLEHTNLRRLITVIALIVVISSISLLIIDPNITNILDSLWYVIVTITSVGYGDVTPTSTAGKLIGIFLVIVSFILLGILIGSISSIYQVKFSKENQTDEKLLEILENQNKEIEALKKDIAELKELIKEE